MGEVSISVDGKMYLGWKEVTIQRSLESLSATFSLQFIDAWEFQKEDGNFERWYLKPGDACEIKIDSEIVLTGYIDQVESSYDGENRSFSVQGRDKTCDLIDSAASKLNFQTFKNYDLSQMAGVLTRDYGITVVKEAVTGKKFRQIAIEHGQSVFDVLENLAKNRGVLLTTDKLGRLVITKPGNKRALVSLEEGNNILRGSFRLDYSKRFKEYIVYGQSFGNVQFFGENARLAKSTASDPSIKRYRRKVIIAEKDATRDETLKRAQWEANYNAAKGTTVEITVNNWRQGEQIGDPLWEHNMIVFVNAPSLSILGEMLIQSVTFKLTESGEITELSLTKPDAWVPNPIVPEDQGTFINIGPLVKPNSASNPTTSLLAKLGKK
jgi:prophage tail gpP-like protein